MYTTIEIEPKIRFPTKMGENIHFLYLWERLLTKICKALANTQQQQKQISPQKWKELNTHFLKEDIWLICIYKSCHNNWLSGNFKSKWQWDVIYHMCENIIYQIVNKQPGPSGMQ